MTIIKCINKSCKVKEHCNTFTDSMDFVKAAYTVIMPVEDEHGNFMDCKEFRDKNVSGDVKQSG